MVKIIEMSIAEYLFTFADDRTALSDTNIRKASEHGRLFCAKDNDTYLGFICTTMGGGIEEILYAFTKPEFRGRGVFASLAKYIVSIANQDVKVSIHEKNTHFDEMEKLCRRLGFKEDECVHVFILDRESKEAWERFKEHQHYDQCRTFRGRNLLTSYVGSDEETFTEDGWFRTGDLVRVDEDGYLFIYGRSKEMIKLANGENIYPAELESCFNELPFVRDCEVFEDISESGAQSLSLECVLRETELVSLGSDPQAEVTEKL